jgi:hypothetical protein
MKFTTLLCAVVTLPAIVNIAAAATRLSDAQMDTMTAGAATVGSLPPIDCPSCKFSTGTSTSMNGVTVTTSSTGTTGGSGGTGGGGGGGTGGGGGGGTGSGTGTGSSGAPPTLGTTGAISATDAAAIKQATTFVVSKP